MTPDLYRRARKYAARRARMVRDAGRAIPRNYAAELVLDALADTWSGASEWLPERCSLLTHVVGAIKLRTWTEIRHARTFAQVAIDGPAANDNDSTKAPLALIAPSHERGPYAATSLVDQVCDALHDALPLDRDAHLLLDCWRMGVIDGRAAMDATGLELDAYRKSRLRLLYQARDLPRELREAVLDYLRR